VQTISDEYRGLNQNLHEADKTYGTSGKNWTRQILELSNTIETKDILDYGCGKSTLAHNIPFLINQYDPAIPKYSERPRPADLVVCTDVLEHIEPELIDEVLKDLSDLTRKVGFFVVATRPAAKTLADGRNAHLIQKPVEWWVPKLCEHFTLSMVQNHGNEEFLIIVEAK